VTFSVTEGSAEETELLTWLSKRLSREEWERVLREIGKQRLLTLPVTVLGLAPRARMIVMELKGVKTLGDLTELSRSILGQELNGLAFAALVARVERFGLELRP
jgi:hypothetical protein